MSSARRSALSAVSAGPSAAECLVRAVAHRGRRHAQRAGDLVVGAVLGQQQPQHGLLVGGKVVDPRHRARKPRAAPRYRAAAMSTAFEPVIPLDRTFDALYGLEVLETGPEEVRARVVVHDRLKQPMGLVHGGVYASIAESIASGATGRAVLPDGNMAQGLSNQTSFLRPIIDGHDPRGRAPRATGAHDLGLGGRDQRRRRAPVRARADDDRRAAAAAGARRSASVAVRDRHPPVATERLRGDLDAGRLLAALVLGAGRRAGARDRRSRPRSRARSAARGRGPARRIPRGSGRGSRRAAASRGRVWPGRSSADGGRVIIALGERPAPPGARSLRSCASR